MENVQTIILAAGRSTRFRTNTSKLIQKICGQEMVLYGTKLLEALKIPITLVVGFQKDNVISTLNEHLQRPFTIVEQKEQLGTGHAISCTQDVWNQDDILIMNGDMPLINEDIIRNLYKKHKQNDSSISFVVAHHTEPSGYGRIVQKDKHISIIEAKEFTGDINEHCYINAGIYLIKRSFLEEHIATIDQNNSKKEFYLTDLVKIASDRNIPVTMTITSYDYIRGINTFKELWAVEHIKRSELIDHWMHKGVRFLMPLTTHIDLNVKIGSGSTIGSGVQLRGSTNIGNNVRIDDQSIIQNSDLGDNVAISAHSIIKDSKLAANVNVGPHSYIYDYTLLKEHVTLDAFSHIRHRIVPKETVEKSFSHARDKQANVTP